MSTFTITSFCSVVWYLCVLGVWVWIGRGMSLFGNHSPHGWLVIFLALLASAALNFVVNPLLWVIAGVNIGAAKKEGTTSRWQFYPPLMGILILASALAAVFTHVKLPPGLAGGSTTEGGQLKKGQAPEVSGIMFSGDPSALIDGHILKAGEEIDGFTVTAITDGAVTFQDADGNITVRRVK